MVDDLKKTKVAIINDNTGYGVLSRETVTKFLAAHNLKPVYTATVDPNKPDVTDELLKAKEAGADVITEWSNATGFVARLVNARGEQNWNVPIVGHPTILQEQVAKLLTKRVLLGQRLRPRLCARDRRCAGQAAGQRPGVHRQAQGHASARTWPPACRPSCRATPR